MQNEQCKYTQPLSDHFGEKTPTAGELFLLCTQTKNKETFMNALEAFLLLPYPTDIPTTDKTQIVLALEKKLEDFCSNEI